MQNKQVNPVLRGLLEYGPLILFFVAYSFLKSEKFTVWGQEYSGFVVVTALFIPLLTLSTLIMWRLSGHLSSMQIVTLVLVIGFGGLSIWFNDERFFKAKPTIIYLLFAGVLGFGLWRGQSYLKSVLGAALPLEPEGWTILTKRITLFFLFLALANFLIAEKFSTDTWVNFKTFGLPVSMLVFFAFQARVFQKYGAEELKTTEMIDGQSDDSSAPGSDSDSRSS